MMKRKVITRGDGVPYLIRRTLFTCRWFSIKLHNILDSDDACLHDHPWAFISIILRGGYIEHGQDAFDGTLTGARTSKWYGRGSILYRPASWAHRLEIIPGRPATTLVITFKKKYVWGFYTPNGWTLWRNYKQENQCE